VCVDAGHSGSGYMVRCRHCRAVEVIYSSYSADTPYPEYTPMFSEGWTLKDAEGNSALYARRDMPLGGYAFVYFRNASGSPAKLTDLVVDGVKLSDALQIDEPPRSPSDHFRASIYMRKLPEGQLATMEAAGAPVWWRPEPMTVPAGGIGEVVLRLRRNPKVDTLNLTIVTDAGSTDTTVRLRTLVPRFATIAFAPGLDTAYLYVSHPSDPGAKPKTITLDGQDVTSRCKIAADKTAGLAAFVLKLPKPLELMSYHHFGAVYPDGSAAMAGLRAWGREMVFGMWGGKAYPGTDEESCKQHLADLVKHNVNDTMDFAGKGKDWLYSQAGWDYCKSIGMGRMSNYPDAEGDPTFYFLYDEPDASDFNTPEVPAHLRLGSMGMYLVKWQDVLHRKGPRSPVLLNIDNTYKPENWYMYHQLADIPCIDPYYQAELDFCYMNKASRYPAHTKPTYVYAAATISQSACQPKPLHVILCSTKYIDREKNFVGRFPTAEEERMMAYYAIAAGAKGLSHWWFSADPACVGCGVDDPAAKALWKGIGLVGAEVRTAGEIITKSCPVALPVTPSRNLWARTLLSGLDTVALIIVNDNVICDRVGTVVQPMANSKVSVEIPTWLTPSQAFEVTEDGIRDVSWKMEGAKAVVDLGTVEVTRFIVFTSDAGLRARLQNVYEEKFSANVKTLKG
jgi:hypothetical protein